VELKYLRPGSLDALVAEKMRRDVYKATKYVGPGDTVLDVGANIGAFCVFVKTFCPAAKVICVEPMSSNIEVLTVNVAGLAVIERLALAAKSGPVTMYDFGLENSGCHSMYDLGVTTAKPVEVLGATLGELLDLHGIDRLRFLKLDCQGAEYDAIPAAGSAVMNRIDVIALEVHGIIEAGSRVLGPIPKYEEKARVLFEVLSATHRWVEGKRQFDSEVVWERK
jgi:FkbM family methyltransferase